MHGEPAGLRRCRSAGGGNSVSSAGGLNGLPPSGRSG